MRGRKPKPDAIKKLQGTYRPDRANENQPRPVEGPPRCPSFLPQRAKSEWKYLVQALPDGLLTKADRAVLAMACMAWARWIDAEEQLKATGGEVLTSDRGGLYQNPWYHVANKSQEQLKALFPELGLSPAARPRLVVPADESEPSLADLLMASIEGQ